MLATTGDDWRRLATTDAKKVKPIGWPWTWMRVWHGFMGCYPKSWVKGRNLATFSGAPGNFPRFEMKARRIEDRRPQISI
jgi:hypothetical protein